MVSPLTNIRVIEYGQQISAPYASRLLADMGADVIKVENPGGDKSRHLGPFPMDVPDLECSGLFSYMNTNKRGITLDLNSNNDRIALKDLLANADIFIEDTKPGTLDVLNLGYSKLSEANPGLVMTSISPFGQTGPYKNYEATDLILWHMGSAGYMTPRYTADTSQEPLWAKNLASFFTGISAAVATLGALRIKEQFGIGQQVDVSGLESVVISIAESFPYWAYEHRRVSRVSRAANAPEHLLKCKNGWVMVHCSLANQWQRFVETMGNPEWASSELFSTSLLRGEYWDSLKPLIEEWTLAHDKEEIFAMAKSKRIPLGPVNTIEELVNSKQLEERKYFVEIDHPKTGKLSYPGSPFRLPGNHKVSCKPAPLLGQHNEEVFRELTENRRGSLDRHVNYSTNIRSPLEGIRVLDITQAWAGPLCTLLLGEMGAEVIKIENPAMPDVWRRIPPFAEAKPGINRCGLYANFNRGKKNVVLDLKKPVDNDLFKQLVRTSDIVVENYAPKVMISLGLGYPILKDIKKDLIMISLSGYGATGPDRDAIAWGSVLEAYSGLSSLIGLSSPQRCGVYASDHISGLIGSFAALTALRYRNLTGLGQHMDISETETIVSCMPEAIMEYTINKRTPTPPGNEDTYMAPHGCYPCKGEDRWVALAVQTDEQWIALCKVLQKPEIINDERFLTASNRIRNKQVISPIIEEWTKNHTAEEITETLQTHGVAACPVYGSDELSENIHLNFRKFFVEHEHPEVGKRKLPGVFAKFTKTPGAITRDSLFGEHNLLIQEQLNSTKEK